MKDGKLRKQGMAQVAEGVAADVEAEVGRHAMEAACARVVVVDGAVDPALSNVVGLPDGAYLGALAGAPAELVSPHLARSHQNGFWSLSL